jgi:transposase
LLSGDLILSYVPEAEQRCWRTLTRTKYQLTRDRVRLQSQLESLLEECQIKLSSVVSDLLGASGRRILSAMANGEVDPVRLKALGDKRLHATDAELLDALSGQVQPLHRALLKLYLQRLDLIDEQMTKLEGMIANGMRAHQDAVVRLASGRMLTRFRRPHSWHRGSGSVLDARRAPANRAVIGPPRAIERCVAFSTN